MTSCSLAANRGKVKRLKIYSSTDFPSYLPKLNQLYDDLFSDGKGFRSQLTQTVAHSLGLEESTQLLLCQTIEFIHNASLLHDDLVDRSHLRRGKPAAWLKFTPEYAVLAGDYLLARVMVNLSRHGNVELIQYTAEMISDLLEGEWIQDSLVRDFGIGLDQLDRVHNLKTGSLFKWCLRAPLVAARSSDQELHGLMIEAGTILGQLFQRSDDLLDFDIRNHEGKAVLGDLKGGYFNSFSVYLLTGSPDIDRRRYAQCQSLGEVRSLIGEVRFEERLKAFDELNANGIELYEHLIDRAGKRWPGGGSGAFQKSLMPLGRYLYWRKKD